MSRETPQISRDTIAASTSPTRSTSARAAVTWRIPVIRRSCPTGRWNPAISIPNGGVVSTTVTCVCLIDFDPCLARYSHEGVPDIRVIAFRGVPVMQHRLA